MGNEREILIQKINIDGLKQLIKGKSNDLDESFINEPELRIEIYNRIPIAILISFICKSSKGFSKRDIFSQVLEGIDEIYRVMDSYKDMSVWGIYYDELIIDFIDYHPQLDKLEVSISKPKKQ
jgi:hypothetical protein